MGDNLFSRCRSLAEVTLPSSIDRVGEGMFTNCAAISAVTIPQGAVSIGAQAFASCTRLKSVTLQDSVTEIGIGVFGSCGVTDIYFGVSEAQWQSVSKLGDSNTALAKMTIHYNSSRPDPGPDSSDDGDDEDWEETYSITVLKADGGKASANVRYAARGGRVTVTAQPDGGYLNPKGTAARAEAAAMLMRYA